MGERIVLDFKGPGLEAIPHPNGLAEAMASAGMDAVTLDRLAGVNAGDIGAWLGGQRHLRPAMATRLSLHLQTTAADLMIGLGGGGPSCPGCNEGSATTVLPSPPKPYASPGTLAEIALMLTAAALMGIVGCVALLN